MHVESKVDQTTSMFELNHRMGEMNEYSLDEL